MDIYQAIVLGVIEGITEFLPVSSTAHMIIASTLMGLKQTEKNVAFEIIIQMGATLAIVLIYLNKINFKEKELWLKVFFGFLPLAIFGFIFSHQIKGFFSVTISAIMFIVGGMIFFIVEKIYKSEDESLKTDNVEDINFRQAITIGLFQVFAIIPGTSRSGATIVGGMLNDLTRKTSADFSFLVAIPTMFAASGYETLKNIDSFNDASWMVLLTGFATSFVVAYFSVLLFLKFVEKYTLNSFAVYRIVFGIILLYLIHTGYIDG